MESLAGEGQFVLAREWGAKKSTHSAQKLLRRAQFIRRLKLLLHRRRLWLDGSMACVPEIDLEPLDLGAEEQNRLARGPDLSSVVEDQALPPLPKSRELLLVHRVILAARREDFHQISRARGREFSPGSAADGQ
jgi:hypothetical protein